MKVFDVTLGYPGTQVGSAIPMTEWQPGSYGALFPGSAGKTYAVKKAVFTDGSYTTIDNEFPSGDDAVQVTSAPSAPSVFLSGIVLARKAITGRVNAKPVTGFIVGE